MNSGVCMPLLTIANDAVSGTLGLVEFAFRLADGF
jgi:hypothetical protein